MPHDQLFKDLLRTFFREFMELFFPTVAARLDFSHLTFLDKELFTDLPDGKLRETDLLAEVHTRDGEPELVLLHVEVQAKRQSDFPFRMWEYYSLLRLRHRKKVFPVVLYLAPGAGGRTKERYAEGLFEEEILTFRYSVVGLADLEADEYLGLENPLGPALSALMRTSRLGRLLQTASTLRQVLHSAVDEARKSLLVHVIDTYMALSEAEVQQLRQIVGQQEMQEVKEMITSFERYALQQGLQQGIVQGKRDTLLHQMRVKFGELPGPVVAKLEAMESAAELDRLSERILTASSVEEMGLTED